MLDRTPSACPFVTVKTSAVKTDWSLEREIAFLGAKRQTFYMNSMFNRDYIRKHFPGWDEECFTNCIDTKLSDAHFAKLSDVGEVWCALEHGNRTASAEAIARLSLRHRNIAGLNLDDFNNGMAATRMSPAELKELRERIRAINPALKIAVVTYAHPPNEFDMTPFAPYVDVVSRWCWKPRHDFWDNYRSEIARLRKQVGSRPKVIQGLYIRDFGTSMTDPRPMPIDIFRKSVKTVRAAMLDGAIDGVIVPQAGWFGAPEHAAHVKLLKEAFQGGQARLMDSGRAVPLLNEGQKAYLALPRAERVKRFADKGERLKLKALGDKPQKVWVDWEGTPTVTWTFALRLGERTVETQTVKTNAVCLNNLEIARTYRWTATDGTTTRSGAFETEDVAPRLIDIPGVPNVRDFGGRIGRGGRRVRQSRVYRSAGLNNNATPEFWTLEELRAQDADGSFARLERKLRDDLAYWTAAATNPPPMHFVDARVSDRWTVVTNGDVAVYTQTVESPADGWITVGCGGEWFWRIRVNGETAFDLMTAGNVKAPVGPDNHLVPLRLRKGANEIRVESKGGDASWTFAAANRPEASLAQIAASKKLETEKRLDREVVHKYRRWKPGTARLTDETRAYMLDVLGIRSDIDLRSGPETSGMTGSPLGPTVTWFHYPAQMYANLGSPLGRQQFSKTFRVFLDEKNYPIDFHCIAGQDRTGAVAFILNGLLGVDEDELYKDWEATCFWNKNVSLRHETSFNRLVGVFDAYPGVTINDRIEKYVLGCGFKPEEISHFRDLMLEEAQ